VLAEVAVKPLDEADVDLIEMDLGLEIG